MGSRAPSKAGHLPQTDDFSRFYRLEDNEDHWLSALSLLGCNSYEKVPKRPSRHMIQIPLLPRQQLKRLIQSKHSHTVDIDWKQTHQIRDDSEPKRFFPRTTITDIDEQPTEMWT